MEFRAETRYLRVSPQKARLVLDLIKGRRVEEARNTLAFTKKRVAAHVEKLLRSALENANFLSTEKEDRCRDRQLYVKRAIANDGPRMKRIRPRPKAGRTVISGALRTSNWCWRSGERRRDVTWRAEKRRGAKAKRRAPARKRQQRNRGQEKSGSEKTGSFRRLAWKARLIESGSGTV